MFAGQMAWGRRILPDDPTSKRLKRALREGLMKAMKNLKAARVTTS